MIERPGEQQLVLNKVHRLEQVVNELLRRVAELERQLEK